MYSLSMTNRNGYEIRRKFKTISAAKDFAKFYPLSVFFAYIYDESTDKMKMQNLYSDKWQKVNNDTFVPYW